MPLPTTWNLSPLAQADNDPALDTALQAVQDSARLFTSTWEPRQDYLSDPLVLRQALDAYETHQRLFGSSGKAGYYFDLRSDQEAANPTIKARVNQIDEASIAVVNEIQFFELRLGSIPAAQQEVFLNHVALAPYHHFLQRLFAFAAHQLSEAEERIDNLKTPGGYSSWLQMMTGILAKQVQPVLGEDGKVAKRGLSEINALLSSTQKPVRDAAALAMHTIMADWRDVAEAEMNAVLAYRKIEDELRGYARADASRHLQDDIASTTVDALVLAATERFPTSQRFYTLKAKLLGLEKLAYHERNIPYGNLTTHYSYADSVQLVQEVFTKLDPRFGEIFSTFTTQGQLDVFPTPGKAGGAHCRSGLPSLPTYIMLNHTDRLQDVLTLAHEAGHGINNVLTSETQHALHGGTPLSTAEVASTFMEDFVLHKLLETATDPERLAILMLKLNDDVSTIFRQVAMYGFEQDLHASYRKEGYQSEAQIAALYRQHMEAYMGAAVSQDPGSENWWIQIHHFRRPFYVYSYASGLLIAKALQEQVLHDPTRIAAVKTFLAAGTSASPEAIFQTAGIRIADPAFWHEGLQQIDDLLNEAEALAKKLTVI